jgi:glycine cleavage system H protein
MKLDPKARYTDSHEWVRKEGDAFVVGITDYAQESLSDVVYVELPEVGDTYEQAEAFGVVESVKAASDIFAPLNGEVVAVNEELEDAPELINQDPYGKGWLVRMTVSDPDEFDDLIAPDDYETMVSEEEE